jgi:hypothetical protein
MEVFVEKKMIGNYHCAERTFLGGYFIIKQEIN